MVISFVMPISGLVQGQGGHPSEFDTTPRGWCFRTFIPAMGAHVCDSRRGLAPLRWLPSHRRAAI